MKVVIALKVPEGAANFEIDDSSYFPQIYLVYELDGVMQDTPITDGNGNPPGKYTFICMASEATQKQMEILVGGEQRAYGVFHGWMWGYYNFESKKIEAGFTLDESYASLLQSLGADKDTHALLKRKG